MYQIESPLPAGDVRTLDPEMPQGALEWPCAWQRDDIDLEACKVRLTRAALAEIEALARALADDPRPVEALTPEGFRLEATQAVMAEVREQVYAGLGFALLDRLPLEGWDERIGKAVSWLLIGMVGPIVNQKWKGTRIYDVRDTGKAVGYGVRRSITNLEQEFHTDGGWLDLAPEVVCLSCLKQAESGGLSRVASLARAHDEMLRRYPDLLARLYQPMWWDRQAEHDPEEPRCNLQPVFAWDGERLTVRYYDDYVRNGHKMMERPLEAEDMVALEVLRAIIEAPENWVEFRLEPGQIEFCNNHLLAHSRTAFTDPGGAGTGRHLLRLWIRHGGGIAFEPAARA